MNLYKVSRLFVRAVVPVFAAGLVFILHPYLDKDRQAIPSPPVIVVPEGDGSESLSIIPGDEEKTKVEYRNILFNRSRGNVTFYI